MRLTAEQILQPCNNALGGIIKVVARATAGQIKPVE